MFFDYLLTCGLACGAVAWRTRHSDLRVIASYAAAAVFALALVNWNLW